jgi:orotidine-5'-phosphate decarboxylase
MPSISSKDRIIFPLDVPSLNEAMGYVDLLKDHVGVFKVGLELFVAEGPRMVGSITERLGRGPGKGIFLDLKFHDIPETVRGAMRSVGALGVEFTTVHCDGLGLVKAVFQGREAGVKVLGVTVLTSQSQVEIEYTGVNTNIFKDPVELVLYRASLAKIAGCSGVVCSGLEAKAVKEKFGADFLVVSPGIRSLEDPVDDQRRVSTPYDAVFNGADYIVVGRPIRKAKDPAEAAHRIAEEVERALKDRGEAIASQGAGSGAS